MIIFIAIKDCCLFCTTTKEEMKISQDQRLATQNRTLESLNSDLTRFHASGSDVKNAKLFNNVIDKPIFNIKLDQV